MTACRSRHEISIVAPYRLDLTVSALRRLATNAVDILTAEGHYMRALASAHGPVVARVRQVSPASLAVTLEGDAREHALALGLVRRILGVNRDVTPFDRAAGRIPWLRPLVRRMRGVKPPRYPTLWEACINAIAFQQVSLRAASAITRRLILALGTRIESRGIPLYAFPRVECVRRADDADLKAAGLSIQKVSTVRRIADMLASHALDEAVLEGLPSPEAAALLQQVKGIGPWTATVILLRGLGRLDVFPNEGYECRPQRHAPHPPSPA